MPKEIQFSPFRLDQVNQCLWRGTEQISLSPKAFAVLLYLAERTGRLVTKQELLDAVWPDIHVTEGVLKRAVLEIRKALSDPVEEPRYIQTLHRRGYRFLSAKNEPQPTLAPATEEIPDLSGLVGRDAELRRLDACFAEATQSSRQMVFISGEAGLGKSTLVDHWMQALKQRDVAMARGRCLQQFGSGEPYLPVFEALDQLSRTLGRRLVEILRSRAPTWLLHMPALISLEDRGKLRDEVFGSTRERMLREITDALEALSGEMPLVIALEDLHWSDPSTIDLLSSIARRTAPARLMILATYRPADAGSGSSPLLAAQNELQLHRQCKVLPVSYLSEEAVGEYLGARCPDSDLPGELSTALHQRTNGNPLYVVCLVDELERSGRLGSDPAAVRDLVPETLQQMFERQASQLSVPEQEMLDVAAAAGELFSVAAVSLAIGRDPGDVEATCEELVRRNLILKRGDLVRFPDGAESPGYLFIHALCRDALYRRIPPGRRSRLHGQLGRAREQLYAADPQLMAGSLGGHFELAGDFPRAIRYLGMAAGRATGRHSNQEAARYLERAFALVERLKPAEQATPRMDLLEQRALMRLAASDMAGAVADFDSLADEAREQGAVDRQTRALLEGAVPLLFVDYRRALVSIEKAHAAQAPDTTLGTVADVYRAFFQMYLYGSTRELAARLGGCVARLTATTDLRLRSQLAWMEAAALVYAADYVAACKLAEEARRCARKAGVFFDYFVATMFLNWGHLHRGDLGQAIRVAREAAGLAGRNGSKVPLIWFTVREAWVQLEAFSIEKPLQTCERLAADPMVIAIRPITYPLLLWLGMARLANNDPAGAWEALEQVRVAFDAGGMAYQVKFLLTHARAECERSRGNPAAASALARELLQIAGDHGELCFLARGHFLLAEIAVGQGLYEEAFEHISRAQAILTQRETWTLEWRVYAVAARILAVLGRQAESDQARQRSLRAAERVAATLADEPALRESFMKRVTGDLAARASSR